MLWEVTHILIEGVVYKTINGTIMSTGRYGSQCHWIIYYDKILCCVYYFHVGTLEAISLDFNLTSELNSTIPTFTLTCTSTGGPTTTVSWRRDGEILVENSSNYSVTSQTLLTNAEHAIYDHTLAVMGRLVGEYQCNVSNNKPSSSNRSLTVVGEYYINR